ncbi:TetR/AcrR family transcriptional regulator [Aneurinibacillus tyrosinisolvens]|uniref:TetR/AcrR family transcriptional regulator n=1 Tax=Aneurinibacillus tyrosinisolvens TaxID=1443435 RepID=UPI000ADD2918|nr:TetR/AcrR family transcriptional regulator [Aneurinibacillus tyrosinisolvens]
MDNSFQQRILSAANKVFMENGYRKADMRSIAKDAGIAVGTIYNYYPNKAVLYQAILEQQWNEFDNKIFTITGGSTSPEEKLRRITDLLLSFVGRHIGMWHEIVEDPNRDSQLRDEGQKTQALALEQLKKHLRIVFAELGANPEWMERSVHVYIASVTHMAMFFPQEMDKNHRFIMSLVKSIVDHL